MDIDIEVAAIQRNLRAHPEIIYITEKQVGGLVGLMRQSLVNPTRDNRIGVLRYLVGDVMWAIAGVEVNSTQNLTSPVASFLIGLFKDEKGDKWEPNEYAKLLLRAIEKRIAAEPEVIPGN